MIITFNIIDTFYGQDDLRIDTEATTAPVGDELLIRVGAGGVCGSDMHYYFEDGIAQIRVREPIILGHEAAGYHRCTWPGCNRFGRRAKGCNQPKPPVWHVPLLPAESAAALPEHEVLWAGVAGEIPVLFNPLVAKEIRITSTFRFHAEFADAMRLIDFGDIDVNPIITQTFPLEAASEAFDLARDRSQSVKVQLSFAN